MPWRWYSSATMRYSQFKMGCMTVFLQTYAATCDPADELKNQHNMRQHVWYTSDVQVRGYYPSYAKRLYVCKMVL